MWEDLDLLENARHHTAIVQRVQEGGRGRDQALEAAAEVAEGQTFRVALN